ncbi:MAG: HAD family hydrolase [Planctomycetaceae bacterium]|nr:HAD family hydrolase [Planctomycetaceae bacterium]
MAKDSHHRNMERPQAVLFDLDDTLYDHLHSARQGLISLSRRHLTLRDVPVPVLEERYSQALEKSHLQMLRGDLTQTEARSRRMQEFFGSFQMPLTDDAAIAEHGRFRHDCDQAFELVQGAGEILRRLRELEIRMAIITNNLVSEQISKLKQLGIEDYFEVVSISEEVGVSKPDPEIFEVTLDRLSLQANEVVMVGDSLESDIRGAQAAGIRTVWLKRRPELQGQLPTGIAVIERDFLKHEESLARILNHRAKATPGN